jgi:hypothetical protein
VIQHTPMGEGASSQKLPFSKRPPHPTQLAD